jgi:probable HAF family extracellular repeat protein
MLHPLFATCLTAVTAVTVLGNASVASAQTAPFAPTYLDPVDIGTLGGNQTRASAENGGRIVGASQTSDGAVHAFMYQDGAMIDLGTLGGASSWAFAINSSGSIAGSASVGGDVATHAFLWTETGGMLDLGTLGGTFSRASGINDDGQVSGWAQIPGDATYHAFLWDPASGIQDLGTFGGDSSFAYDVVSGMVCGEAMMPDGSSHAFTASSSGGGLNDLGTLGGSYSAAINCGTGTSQRPVVGESSIADDSATHAVSWDANGLHDIGTLGGAQSRGLRTSFWGEIFGESQTGDGEMHPFQSWRFLRGLPDFSRVLGDDSRIDSVVPTSAGSAVVVSGTGLGLTDVHAYLASVPQAPGFNPDAARTITTGVFEARTFSSAHFAFQAGETEADIGISTELGQCHPCAAGANVSLSMSRLMTEEAFGSATVRGTSYPSVAVPQVQIAMTADSFTVPDTGELLLTVSAPFTFSGFVLGAARSDWQVPDKLFGIPLTGAGTVTLQLSSCDACVLPDGRRYYDQQQLMYSFEPQ